MCAEPTHRVVFQLASNVPDHHNDENAHVMVPWFEFRLNRSLYVWEFFPGAFEQQAIWKRLRCFDGRGRSPLVVKGGLLLIG